MAKDEKIAIVGSGFVGRSWAMLFASVGYEVSLYDVKPEQVTAALADINEQLIFLEKSGLLRGKHNAREQFKLIKGASSMKECIKGAKHIQESVFEDVELKKKVFMEIDQIVGPDTVLSSSASCILPSKISADLNHRTNFVISHPINPPYYVPVVELVPAPWTSTDVMARTQALMTEIGQSPVVFTREISGFGINRIQYAILKECFSLVNSGVVSAPGVEKIMKEGLGFRYAWMGPLETALLNANGMKDYLNRYSNSMSTVIDDFEGKMSYKSEDNGQLIDQLDEMVPLDQLQDRRTWRDERLLELAKLKKKMECKEKSSDGQ